MLIEHFEKDPRQITEAELQSYFLYRRNETRWSASTLKVCYCALKSFFINVPRQDWHLFKILNAQPEKRLSCVLTESSLPYPSICENVSQLRIPDHRLLLRSQASRSAFYRGVRHRFPSDADPCPARKRTLQFHPLIHYVVPGGALSSEDGRWHPSRADKDLRGFRIFWKPRRSFLWRSRTTAS